MDDFLLKNGETFVEFPDKKLKVSSEDNIYLLKYQQKYTVVRANLALITNIEIDGKEVIKEEKEYYSVIDNEKLLKETIIYLDSLVVSNLIGDIKLFKLSEIFRLEVGQTKCLDLDDVEALNNYKDSDFIEKNPTPKQYYF